MKRINNAFVYALLLTFSLTLSSCFIFHKHKSVTKNSTDSTAYNKIESSLQQHQSEAWNNYLNQKDSSSSMVYFYDGNEPKWIRIDTNGTIEAKGNIKEVVHKSNKQTTKQDSGNKQSKVAYKYVNTKYDIVKTNNITKTLTVTRKPDYFGYLKIAVVLALVVFVVVKWQGIKAKAVDLGRGVFTRFFH